MSRPPGRLKELNEAVLDRRPVDWARERELATSTEEKLAILGLELVARIASAHESLYAEGPSALPFFHWKHLRLSSLIGAGTHGELYLARDDALGQEVALKLLRAEPEDTTRWNLLLEEARRLARVRHENVVRVLGVDVDHGRIGFWMEHVPGRTLADLLEERGALSAEEAIPIGLAVCRGLAAAHEAGVVHGDVKPTNVLREESGRIYLVDFSAGRTRAASSSDPATRRGTPLFMAPETLLRSELSPASDIYGVGVLLFHLVTGRFPCEGSDVAALEELHRAGARESVRALRPELPPSLAAIIERCLEPDPGRRFRTAEDLAEALERSLRDPGGAERRSRLRSPGVAVALGVIALLAAAALGAVGALRHTPPAEVESGRVLAERSLALAIDAYEKRDFETARASFRDAIGYDSTFALAYFHWSQCEAFWEESEEARRLAEIAIVHSATLSPDEKDRVASWNFLLHEKPQEAIAVLKGRVARKPKDADAWFQLARSYWFHSNETEAAIQCYRKALDLDPRKGNAYNDLAYCYLQTGRPDSAVAWARRNIAFAPSEPNPYDTMGDILQGAQPESAEAYYRLALQKKSDFVVPLEKLAVISMLEGRFAETESLCARMQESDDLVYRAKGRWARECQRVLTGRLEEAITGLTANIAEDRRDKTPRHASAGNFLLRGWVYGELGRFEEGLADFDRAAREGSSGWGCSPDRFVLCRVWMLFDAGRDAEARALADTLASARHANPRWDYVGPAAQGLVALREREYGKAADLFTRALETEKRGLFEIVYLRAEALAGLGDLEGAASDLTGILRRTVHVPGHSPILVVRGWRLLGDVSVALGRTDEARRAYGKVIELWGENAPGSEPVLAARAGLARLGGA